MARRRKTRVVYRTRSRGGFGHRKKFSIPLAVVSGFIPLGVGIWNRRTSPTSISGYVLGSLTGYVPGSGWNAANMKEGALPILAGFIGHYLAGRLGVNRALGRAGIPIIRI